MLKILPQLFYESPDIQKILVDGLSCIVYKKVSEPVMHKEGYVSAHAITLVLKGTLQIENADGPLATIREGQMIFVPKGLYMISDILPARGSFEAMVFFFDEELISNFVNTMGGWDRNNKCITHKVLNYTDSLRLFTESLLQLYTRKENSHRQLTRIKLFEMLHLVSLSQPGDCFIASLNTLNNKERKSLRVFMNANFSKPLSIEDYAYLTGRSLSSFRRNFKTQFGISPKQWLIDKRLERAHELLSKNNTSITDVVMETGYENMSHFIKAFHKKFGVPPKQFLIRKRREVLV
jgi:AraC family transcriptional regulator, exoenzyme S synthesis regulatory protein ExsA